MEIIQLVVVADDLLDGKERRVDGAVAQADALQHAAVLDEADMSAGGNGVAAVDDILVQLIGGGHLKRHAGNDGIQLAGGYMFLFGGDGLEGLVYLGVVLVAQGVAQLFHRFAYGGKIIVHAQHHAGRIRHGGYTAIVGRFLAACGAEPFNLGGDAPDLGVAYVAAKIKAVAAAFEDGGDIAQGGDIAGAGNRLDFVCARADGGDGAGSGHGERVGAQHAQPDIGQFGHVGFDAADKGRKFLREH